MTALDRRWIEAHIPHRGAMCLLDEVLVWDTTLIRCRSATHRASGNPLRAHGRLGAACGIEYAAQAMAVHGALIASAVGTRAPEGFLASVRNVQLCIERLDELRDDLIASATRVHGDEATALYDFSLCEADRLLLCGRAAIAFKLPGRDSSRRS